jgi:hypothetical protein
LDKILIHYSIEKAGSHEQNKRELLDEFLSQIGLFHRMKSFKTSQLDETVRPEKPKFKTGSHQTESFKKVLDQEAVRFSKAVKIADHGKMLFHSRIF